jgi:hypothetical protein
MREPPATGQNWRVMEEGRARRPRCGHCGGIIGVYEPLLVGTGAGARETSLAAEPELSAFEAHLLHRACYDQLQTEEAVD